MAGRSLYAQHLGPFQVDSRLVSVPVLVTDRNGHPILGLKSQQFEVLDEGLRQQISSFAEWDVPASIALVADLSGSMRGILPSVRSATRSFFRESAAGDEALLVVFSDRPEVAVNLTSDMDLIPEHLTWLRAQGGTALFDGVQAGIHALLRTRPAHRVLIVLTDGGENSSRLTAGELLSNTLEADVQVFGIAFRRDSRDVEEQRGRLNLNKLANQTGGELIILDNASTLPAAVGQITRLIHQQYLIGFKPGQDRNDGKWHRLRVSVHPEVSQGGLQIHARRGYLAANP